MRESSEIAESVDFRGFSMVARHTMNNGESVPPLQYQENADPVETEDDADDIADASEHDDAQHRPRPH